MLCHGTQGRFARSPPHWTQWAWKLISRLHLPPRRPQTSSDHRKHKGGGGKRVREEGRKKRFICKHNTQCTHMAQCIKSKWTRPKTKTYCNQAILTRYYHSQWILPIGFFCTHHTLASLILSHSTGVIPPVLSPNHLFDCMFAVWLLCVFLLEILDLINSENQDAKFRKDIPSSRPRYPPISAKSETPE